MTAQGVVTTVAGGSPLAGQVFFKDATAIAVDSSGGLYITDATDNNVWLVTGGNCTRIGGGGAGTSSTNPDGFGLISRFSAPHGIVVDPAGTIFVADQNNNAIRRGALPGPPILRAVRTSAGTLREGSAANFVVAAGGAPAPTLRWFRNGVAIAGATSNQLAIAAVREGDAGEYSVVATNSNGSTPLSLGTLAVQVPPAIVTPPQALVLASSGTSTLSVAATGTNLAYQWYRDEQPISGATSATYTVTVPGTYHVVVYNPLSSITSARAVVTAAPAAPAARLVNIATRGPVNGGDGMVAGFVTETSAGGPKRFLIRAVGPALGLFGLPSVLPRPTLTLYRGSDVVATNTGWDTDANGSSIATAAQSVGAFPLTTGSLDAAVLADLPGAAYTVELTGAGTSSGTALIEVYEIQADRNRLLNLSTRGRVTASDALTAGVVVSGGDVRLLIRAAGPALAQFGLPGTLARPRLTLYRGSQTLVVNEGWDTVANAAEISATATSVGAFGFTAGSRDAAVLVTLSPGNYTAEITGTNGSTGIALIEAYLVP